ncbi:hypothetical protein L1987_74035 [Smallanthus sonchifolius]|uniref:Uncharacterized protein n=1 Tax=Smallanthus sonchifolius TaxID=185202 RepID=A0ACB9A618_9ASTR|nr:hypothetical protein L1987_74035 [Smallanthus sonchifolius]
MMGCFWCCITQRRAKRKKGTCDFIETKEESFPGFSLGNDSFRKRYITNEMAKYGKENISSQFFTYEDLSTATNNFNYNSLIGEGGFGRIYKGHIANKSIDVAVKKLDRNGYQGNQEFLVEALLLSLLNHSNLVNLIGYCCDGDQRILVYKYMPNGSLEDHLFNWGAGEQKPLEWETRVKIAIGAARGLEYLHDKADPPAEPLFKDRRKFHLMADPLLEGRYPTKGLYQALALAAMCLQEDATKRPTISNVVKALEYLASENNENRPAEDRSERD